MRIKNLVFLFLLFVSQHSFSQEDHWEVYMARYEDGPGSTVVNMSLIDNPPIKKYPYLLRAGVKLKKCSGEGLFTDGELDMLHSISDKIKTVIDAAGKNIAAGTFTYQCQRTDYYYIKDTSNVRKAVAAAFTTNYPDYEYKIEIKPDTSWDAYLTFLYPNEVTREYMENDKVIMNLVKSGDDLSKPRLVDHWLYFKTKDERASFIQYALEEKFKVEDQKYQSKYDLPYSLHLTRVDKVDVASISDITLRMRKKAKELHGQYDGWETMVVK